MIVIDGIGYTIGVHRKVWSITKDFPGSIQYRQNLSRSYPADIDYTAIVYNDIKAWFAKSFYGIIYMIKFT